MKTILFTFVSLTALSAVAAAETHRSMLDVTPRDVASTLKAITFTSVGKG